MLITSTHTFLVDGNGKIVWDHNNYSPGDEHELYDELIKIAKYKKAIVFILISFISFSSFGQNNPPGIVSEAYKPLVNIIKKTH